MRPSTGRPPALLAWVLALCMAPATPAIAKTPRWQYAELAPDVDWVIGAIATRMRDEPIPGEARKYLSFSGGLERRIPEERFHYPGFTLDTVAIDVYHSLESDPDRRWVSAMLRFQDLLGRRADAAVRAEYRMQGETIIIDSAVVAPLSARAPRVDFFYVPADGLPGRVLHTPTTHGELWNEVVEHSLRLNRPEEWPQGEHDYLVFAFVMDRLAPDASLNLRISDDADGMDGDGADSKVLNFDGWFAAVSGGRFDLGGAEQPYFKVLYTPGTDVPGGARKPRMIGLFTNRPD